VAAGVSRTTDEGSLEKLFVDLGRQLTRVVEILGTVVAVHNAAGQWTAERLRKYLEGVLGKTWRDGWKKSPTRTTKPPSQTEYLVGGHSSVFKIVRGLHRTVPEGNAQSSPKPSKQYPV